MILSYVGRLFKGRIEISRVGSYAFAVAAVALTVLARGTLMSEFAQRPFLILFIFPVVASACLAGFESGLVATLLAVLVVDYFYLAPVHSFRISDSNDFIVSVLFVSIGLLLSFLIDVYQRRSMQLEAKEISLKNSEELLGETQKMENRLRAIVGKTSEMITMRDAQGDLIYASPSLQSIMGYTFDEIKKVPFSNSIHPDDLHAIADAYAKLKPGHSAFGLRMRVRSHTGSWHWLEGSISNFLNDADVSAYVANFHDVSEQIRLEDQLAQAGKMESVGQLAAGIAHDFNNLITVISGYSNLALENLPPGDPTRACIEPVLKSAKRAAELTKQLLAFSRKQVMQPKVLNLNLVVQDMGAMLKRVLGENITISIILTHDLYPVFMDPGQLEQIILNLALNARDAMPHGGQLSIETFNVTKGSIYATDFEWESEAQALLVLTDTGAGMAAETQAKIFEPFFSTKEVGRGTGLGLSTVYGIVKQSGGNILVQSTQGLGTSFKVYLPKTNALPVAEPDPAILSPRRASSETILLVEDEPALRQLFKRILATEGYQVLESPEGRSALEICRNHGGKIHLLLTDVIMPGMGGLQLSEQALALRPDMKVAFMSGYTDHAIQGHGQLKAGTVFIAKPCSRELLLEKIRDLLG